MPSPPLVRTGTNEYVDVRVYDMIPLLLYDVLSIFIQFAQGRFVVFVVRVGDGSRDVAVNAWWRCCACTAVMLWLLLPLLLLSCGGTVLVGGGYGGAVVAAVSLHIFHHRQGGTTTCFVRVHHVYY